MRSSFEDLDARDLMVKMDLQSGFFLRDKTFLKLEIQKDSHMHACGDVAQSMCYRACGRVSLVPHVRALALSYFKVPSTIQVFHLALGG